MKEVKINLITKPRSFLVGQTQIYHPGLDDFMEFIAEENGHFPQKLQDIKDHSLSEEYSDLDNMAELGGRLCYQSYFTGRDTEPYFQNIMESGHGSVLEHGTFNFILTGISRSLTHQLIRHRMPNVSEMSQRFVGANEKTGVWNFVVPSSLRSNYENGDTETISQLQDKAERAVYKYLEAQDLLYSIYEDKYSGFKLTKIVNEAAREFLPSWVETRVLWTVNPRALRHILDVRGSEHADKQIFDWCQDLLDIVTKDHKILSLQDIKSDGKNITSTYGKV